MVDRRFGPYSLVRPLGSGGMGQVWEAIPDSGGPPVALKWIADGAPHSRFLREMQVGRSLDHPHLVRLLDCGVQADHPWLAMELLKGATLSTLRKQRPQPWPPALVVELARQMLEGVEALHRAGVVHRDLKPSNIFVSFDGTVRVIDFGIAIPSDEDPTLTRSERLMGSVRYASPEQAQGEVADARSDLYSLGLVLFELFSGQRVYSQPTELGVISALMSQPVPRLSTFEPGIQPELDEVLSRALCRDRNQRISSAAAFREALLKALGGAAWTPADVASWVSTVTLQPEDPITGELPPVPTGTLEELPRERDGLAHLVR